MEKMTFIELKKYAKKDMSSLKLYKLAVLGNCSTQHLSMALKGYGYNLGYNLDLFDSDYNQIDAQIMDDFSELYEKKPNAVLIYMATEKLFEEFCNMPLNEKTQFADNIIKKITMYWEKINSTISTNILQFNFCEINISNSNIIIVIVMKSNVSIITFTLFLI